MEIQVGGDKHFRWLGGMVVLVHIIWNLQLHLDLFSYVLTNDILRPVGD